MKDHHPILKHQIQEHIGTAAPAVASLHAFLESVNEIYWRLQPHHLHSHTPKTPEQLLAHEQYQTIFENSSTAMTIVSAEAVILLANAEFEKLSAYPRTDLENKKSLAEFFSTRDFEQFLTLSRHRKTAPQQLAHRAETKLFDRNGNDHHVLLSLSAIPPTQHYIATFIDISERKRAEEEILRQRAELKRVNDRLRSLHELSVVTTRSLDLKAMLTDVLHTVTRIELLQLEPKGIVFTSQGKLMNLSAHIGVPKDLIALHKQIDQEIALCCSTQDNSAMDEIYFCEWPHFDCAFAAQNSAQHMQSHIIVPLRSHNTITGVMCLWPRGNTRLDADMQEILKTIANQIGIAIDNALLYEKTKALSLHDHLTGLPNRRLLQLEIERNFAKSKRYGTQLSVLMMDIDYFKHFNDTNGHIAGDSLLGDLARVMLRELRETDLAVRYGGEEFLILLPETSFQHAFDTAERLRLAIAEKTPVTVSIGLSSYADEMDSYADLISDADRSLYLAKSLGKNRVEGFNRQMRLPLEDSI